MALVRCLNPRCSFILFETVCADIVLYRHRGREVVAVSVLRVVCDKCGTVWQAAAIGDEPLTAEQIQEALQAYRVNKLSEEARHAK